jgi:DNA-binding NtrC family response regulator
VDESATLDQTWGRGKGASDGQVSPGLLLLFSGGKPRFETIPLTVASLTIGRGVGGAPEDDRRMSRHHAEVSFEVGSVGSADSPGRWRIRDLASHNGTFLDGAQLSSTRVTETGRVLRIGETLFGLIADLRPFQRQSVEVEDGVVLGPTTKRSWDEIERLADARTLHVVGESGTGKELACRHFHRKSTRATGPYVAVNCANIQPTLAERLLFGTRKGAYSGADTPAEGYLQAANGGTLFFDEIAELELSVQAKLLRAIETDEVLPLGATRPVRVDVAFCSGTHRDLRTLVNERLFRSDLLYRIAVPEVRLAPLRHRLEEIPWLIETAVGKLKGMAAHVSLVEACLCRDWPGNVRELMAEVLTAASTARRAGRARIEAGDLAATAGRNLSTSTILEAPASRDGGLILEALREEKGNIAAAARRLGMHRTQLRRWMIRNQVTVPRNK